MSYSYLFLEVKFRRRRKEDSSHELPTCGGESGAVGGWVGGWMDGKRWVNE